MHMKNLFQVCSYNNKYITTYLYYL
jgi:hypothetical protein